MKRNRLLILLLWPLLAGIFLLGWVLMVLGERKEKAKK